MVQYILPFRTTALPFCLRAHALPAAHLYTSKTLTHNVPWIRWTSGDRLENPLEIAEMIIFQRMIEYQRHVRIVNVAWIIDISDMLRICGGCNPFHKHNIELLQWYASINEVRRSCTVCSCGKLTDLWGFNVQFRVCAMQCNLSGNPQNRMWEKHYTVAMKFEGRT